MVRIILALLFVAGVASAGLVRPANVALHLSGQMPVEPPPSGFTCGTSTVDGVGGITYGTVVGEDGECWLDRNLGATQVATNKDDADARGYYYQWGRLSDGHQIPTSSVITTLSTTDVPGHGDFIEASPDWRDPGNDSLWQGVSGINNPCPTGWRVPTSDEWATYFTDANVTDTATAYASALKLVESGYRFRTGSISGLGTYNRYWSSTVDGVKAVNAYIYDSGVSTTSTSDRTYGEPVRCIKD